MDLSTALTISLFLYGIFLLLIGIEYFSDKRRKDRAPPQKPVSPIQKPQEQRGGMGSSPGLQDLEEGAEVEEPVESPKIWEEEEFE